MDIVEFSRSDIWKVRSAKIHDREIEMMRAEIRGTPKCRMLQIGTKYGYTAFSLLADIVEVGGSIDTVDIKYKRPLKDKKKPIREDIVHMRKMIRKYNLYPTLKYYIDGSSYFFTHTAQDMYHIIFIDGDHRYPRASEDLTNSLKFLKSGGVIFFHDIRNTKSLRRKHSKCCYHVFHEFKHPGYTKKVYDTKYVMGTIRSI